MGLRELIILDDSLRDGLDPLARVLHSSLVIPVSLGLLGDGVSPKIPRGNAGRRMVGLCCFVMEMDSVTDSVIFEMERDALIAHGISKFLKEKTVDNSDAYVVHVCDICGLFAQRFERDGNKDFITEDDTFYCPACKNYNEISKIIIPYAFKLLIQELMSLNIASRIRTKKDTY